MNRDNWVRATIYLAAGVTVLVSASSAKAQFGPVVWQQPAPIVWQQPAPIVWQQPAPVVWQQSAPVVVSQRPAVVMSPTAVTRVYRPPIITYQPVVRTYTRRRPILGGTVTRSRYGYRRIAF